MLWMQTTPLGAGREIYFTPQVFGRQYYYNHSSKDASEPDRLTINLNEFRNVARRRMTKRMTVQNKAQNLQIQLIFFKL